MFESPLPVFKLRTSSPIISWKTRDVPPLFNSLNTYESEGVPPPLSLLICKEMDCSFSTQVIFSPKSLITLVDLLWILPLFFGFFLETIVKEDTGPHLNPFQQRPEGDYLWAPEATLLRYSTGQYLTIFLFWWHTDSHPISNPAYHTTPGSRMRHTQLFTSIHGNCQMHTSPFKFSLLRSSKL